MDDYLKGRMMRKLELEAPLPTKKERKPIPKVSENKKKEIKAAKDAIGDTELVCWFRAKMKVMGERCYWCGCKVENKVYSAAIFSICHILDKRDTKCPSVKCHPLNWVTLCPDHHHQFDKMNWEEREKLGFWETVKERLIMIYPDLDISERRHFPDSVLKYMDGFTL